MHNCVNLEHTYIQNVNVHVTHTHTHTQKITIQLVRAQAAPVVYHPFKSAVIFFLQATVLLHEWSCLVSSPAIAMEKAASSLGYNEDMIYKYAATGICMLTNKFFDVVEHICVHVCAFLDLSALRFSYMCGACAHTLHMWVHANFFMRADTGTLANKDHRYIPPHKPTISAMLQ